MASLDRRVNLVFLAALVLVGKVCPVLRESLACPASPVRKEILVFLAVLVSLAVLDSLDRRVSQASVVVADFPDPLAPLEEMDSPDLREMLASLEAQDHLDPLDSLAHLDLLACLVTLV